MSTEHSGTAPAAPRTLADDLRARDDAELAALLRARPDLLSPVPNDLTQLATRAGTRASVVRAVERLDRFALQTAEAIAIAPDPCPYETLASLLTGDEPEYEPGYDPEYQPGYQPEPEYAPEPELVTKNATTAEHVAAQLPRALRTLREQALLWGGDDRLHLVRTARELLSPSPSSPSPTGLGPTLTEATSGMSPGRLQDILGHARLPATHDPVSALASLTALFADPDRTAALLADAPSESLTMLEKLRWGPPYGTVQADAPSPPVRWLLDRALLVRTSPRTVVLPREVALQLRGGRAHRRVEPLPPHLMNRQSYPPEAADETAAGQALAALGTVEDLLTSWESDPPQVLRAGGLGVRDLKRTATVLDVPEPTAAFWIELAYAAGLLAPDGQTDETYAPTPAYDEWLELPAHERWALLIRRWLPGTRVPGLVGTRDAKSRALAALGQGLDRGLTADVRRRTLQLLTTLEPGAAPTHQSVLERLRWECPLRGGGAGDLRTELAEWALHEAELLGVTGRGALASYARGLVPELAASAAPVTAATPATPPTAAELDAATARAADGLAPHIPEPLDHILLQADLTAVAPGPLERALSAMLGVLADVESKGGATVYRFTPGSVRRALDAGRTAGDIHAFLAAHSRTPVPQPLSYLVDDMARRHGHLRVGAASSYVRCDDEALLTEITADKRSEPLRLRLLAPTVLASPLPPDQLLAKLREMGYAPAAESAAGDVLITRGDIRRTPPRTPPEPVPDGPPMPDAALLAAAVRAVRAGDHAATAAPGTPRRSSKLPVPTGPLPRTDAAEAIRMLRAAAGAGDTLWIGYVNADGAASQRVIAPVRVEGGFVTAYDHTADEVRTYPLHRITGVAEPAGS